MTPECKEILELEIGSFVFKLEEKTKKMKFDLFCTEGATAAMIYIFKSLKINGILHEKDRREERKPKESLFNEGVGFLLSSF